MELFKCRYLTHENEEIIGFCLNENCKNATQFCYECLKKCHSDHQDDCIRFVTMNSQIKQFIQVYNHQNKQIKEIIAQLKNCFEQILKKIDQDIKILENMDQQLLNKDYLTFKSQINIIKQYHSKEKEKYIQQQIIEMNKFFDTIKTVVSVQTQVINLKNQNTIKIVEKNQEQTQLKSQEVLFDNEKGLSIKLICSCPPQCVCQSSQPRQWNHSQCSRPLYITSKGDVFCNSNGCQSYFIKDHIFQCEKAKINSISCKYKTASQLLMSIAQSIQQNKELGENLQIQFVKEFCEKVVRRWNA